MTTTNIPAGARVQTIKGTTVLSFLNAGIDYVEVKGKVFSINGGFFFEPRTGDCYRWAVDAPPAWAREQAASNPTGTAACDIAAYEFFHGIPPVGFDPDSERPVPGDCYVPENQR